MQSPHRLRGGDRLTIGQYIVRVDIEGEGAAADCAVAARFDPARLSPAPSFSAADDIRDTGAPPPPSIDRRELMSEPAGRSRAARFPEPVRRASRNFSASPLQSRRRPRLQPPIPPPIPFRQAGAGSLVRSVAGDAASCSSASPSHRHLHARRGKRTLRALGVGAAANPRPPPPPVARSPGDARRRGTVALPRGTGSRRGRATDTFAGRDPGELGFELGEYVKVSVEQLAHLLRARAAAKAITKSSSRTMISAMDNNPLKFIPVPAEIIEIMFTRRRPGFLGSKASLEAGFGDLKRHELATFAAMQKALGRLLDDISPEAIEAKAGGSAFSSKKSRAWDTFVARWESKTEAHENGMLDVFFGYFAEAYDEFNKKG